MARRMAKPLRAQKPLRGRMRCEGLALAATLSGFCALSLAAGGQEARLLSYGRHLAQECAACHRVGAVDSAIPSLLGRDAEAFVRTLKDYQSGTRSNPVMVSVAKSLNEEQMRALAAFYASLPNPAGNLPSK